MKQKNKNPYTTTLWPDGKIYLELSTGLIAKWIEGNAGAVWLVTWLLKVVSEYEANTCLHIWVLPPVVQLARLVGLDGFLHLPKTVSIMIREDDQGFTDRLGADATKVEWGAQETVAGVQHELGHVFGMDHLQKRSDRELYLEFKAEACRAYWDGRCDVEFTDPDTVRSTAAQTKEECISDWVAQYDVDASLSIELVKDIFNYGSIMAYPYDECITARTEPLDAFKARADHPPEAPYVSGVTALDYEQIRLMYSCPTPLERAVLAIGNAIADAVSNIVN